jgi:hypothetical protein
MIAGSKVGIPKVRRLNFEPAASEPIEDREDSEKVRGQDLELVSAIPPTGPSAPQRHSSLGSAQAARAVQPERGSLLPKRTPASVAANQDCWYRVGRYQRTKLSLLQEFFDEDLGMDQEGDHMPHCIGTHPGSGVDIAKTVRARNEMALGNSTIALPMASHPRVQLRFASPST